MDRFRGRKLQLDYPCPWAYTVIGTDEFELRRAIDQAVGDETYDVERSRTSRTGQFCSLHVRLTVRSEAQRLSITHALQSHPQVRYLM